MESWDIVIVGGGPAGLSTWLHLHAHAPQLAARTALLEAATYPRDKPCGGGLTPLADRLLEGLDIALGVDAVEIDDVAFRFGEAIHHVRRPAAMRVVRRREFDAALARVAEARGLHLRQGEACRAIHQEPDGVIVETAARVLRAAVVVGADGVRSRLRRALGLPPGGIARLRKQVVPLEAGCALPTRARFDFAPIAHGLQGYLWWFPCREEGRAAVDTGLFDSGVHPRRSTPMVAPAGSRAAALRWFTPGDPIAAPRVLLVGDAAGVDAALGEGIAQALDYGDFAAHLLVDAFARGDFSFATAAAALAAHPLGQALASRYQLARALYGGQGASLADVGLILRAWLPAS